MESRTDDFFEGLTESLGGQANGLCGAAVPGLLFLTTGLDTGHTRVTVEVLDAPAPIGDDWEEVVEASFRPAPAKVVLVPGVVRGEPRLVTIRLGAIALSRIDPLVLR